MKQNTPILIVVPNKRYEIFKSNNAILVIFELLSNIVFPILKWKLI